MLELLERHSLRDTCSGQPTEVVDANVSVMLKKQSMFETLYWLFSYSLCFLIKGGDVLVLSSLIVTQLAFHSTITRTDVTGLHV